MKTIVLLLFMPVLMLSCADYDCSKPELSIATIGFSPEEADTIILRKFAKSGSFTSLLDTLFIDHHYYRPNIYHDTIITFLLGTSILQHEYDYEVFLPSVNKRFQLTDIIEVQTSRKWSTNKVGCYNPISSYKVDGQLITNTIENQYSSILYFTK